MKTALPPLPVVATEGCRIRLADGRELIDGVASWWSAAHSYNHPHIRASVEKQLHAMPHVMFGGLVHEQALTLAKRLCDIAPQGLSRVFFADSGSVAVEVALKIALQYWSNQGKTGKNRFVCFRDGYHGDTLGAMSVSDPEHSLHQAFKDVAAKQFVVDVHDLAAFEKLLKEKQDSIAGVIIEPLVQGAGGMKFHSAETLTEIFRLTKKFGLLFIADEIATGFYRTGKLFACNEAGIAPDIMCLGKALTGGTITLGATLVREAVFAAFLSDNPDAALMHGPTFMGNALACAAANASLDIFQEENYEERVAAIEAQMKKELEPCRNLPGVVDVRVKGAIGVVQMQPGIDVRALRPKFIERGVWARPFGDIIYLAPPLVISAEELRKLTGAVIKILRAL